MKRWHRAASAFCALAIVANGGVAMAQSWPSFSPASASSFMSLLPDTCIPTGMGGTYCITFTNATYTAAISSLLNQNQMGQLQQQALQGLSGSQIQAASGMSDPTGATNANAQCNSSAGDASNPADDQAAFIMSNETANMLGLSSVGAAAFNEDSDPGNMSASEWNTVATMQLQAQQQQQQCFAAAQHQQQQQQAVNTATTMMDVFDTNNSDPEAGWYP